MNAPIDRELPARLPDVDRRIALWLALFVFSALLPFVHGRFSGSDEVGVFETTRALYERADLSLGTIDDSLPHIYEGRGGKRYSHFAVGQSILALPLFGLGRAADALLGEGSTLAAALAGPPGPLAGGNASGELEIFFVTLYGPLATGVLAALFFAFQRRLGNSRRASLIASLLVVTTTYVAAMSVFFLRHTTEAICILGGLYGFFVYARSGAPRAAAFGSALASATFLVRVPAALAGLGIGGLLLWAFAERRRLGDDLPALRSAALAVAAPLTLATALHVATNYWRWERWLGSPMFDQAVGFVTPIQVGLQGFLLSPGCSVFVHAPLLCLLPWMLPQAWREQRALTLANLVIALTFLIVCSTYLFWTGLWSAPGPRYVFVAIPLLLLPLGKLVDRSLGAGDVSGGRGMRAAIVGLAGLGALVQLALLLARWPAVIRLMEWQTNYGPLMDFVFVAKDSPLVGCFRAVSQGLIDAWLWVQWTGGGPVLPPRPGMAIAGALVCIATIAVTLRALRDAMAEAAARDPEPSGRARDTEGLRA